MPAGNKTATDGLVLFAHGSRDPRWAEPFQAIAARVSAAAPGVRVSLAFLEIMAPDLATSVGILATAGARCICIVPLFLGQGGHAREDLPRLVEAVRAQYPGVEVRLAGIAGDAPVVLDALAAYCIAQAQGASA
jgi:sirohydrochlorin cobaltochelatase